MFLFYLLSFFKKGDTIQGGTLFKGGFYLRKYGNYLCYELKCLVGPDWSLKFGVYNLKME